MDEYILEVRNLTKYFGGLKAIDNVSFKINRGEIYSIIGPNGAGKTTLFNMITGFIPPTEGEIFFQGQKINGLKPYQIARLGIGRTFQLTTLFMQNTVLENLLIGQKQTREFPVFHSIMSVKRRRVSQSEAVERAHAVAEFIGLGTFKNTMAAILPHGAQKQLSIGLALSGDPDLILLDEPLGGVDMDEIDMIIELIKKIRDEGKTICLIEHKMRVVMNISDRILALSYGKKLVEDLPEVVASNEDVIASYLGDRYAARG
ncbi:MAG: ABC transporter ATP-binding protein [Syntrophales bacterium]|nr:ABC transporter ATP-binding protein [Syntrophales bacterium]